MIKQFKNLSEEEISIVLKAPALISVSVACSDSEVNLAQKADAVNLSHMKTFTANPLLIPFYCEVEKHFKEQFEAAVKEYGPFDRENMRRLKMEIEKIRNVLKKLEPEFAKILLRSFEKYERHVTRAVHSVVEDFIFPIPIPGLNA